MVKNNKLDKITMENLEALTFSEDPKKEKIILHVKTEYDYIDERNTDVNEYEFNSLIEGMDYEDKLKYAEEIINDIIIWTWNILADLYPNEYNNY